MHPVRGRHVHDVEIFGVQHLLVVGVRAHAVVLGDEGAESVGVRVADGGCPRVGVPQVSAGPLLAQTEADDPDAVHAHLVIPLRGLLRRGGFSPAATARPSDAAPESIRKSLVRRVWTWSSAVYVAASGAIRPLP